MENRIKILELFGGIGAPRKALINLGVDHKNIDYVEIQTNRVRAYNAMFDNRYKPQTVVGYNLKADILIHGSPCQDFSRARLRWGERKGGARGSDTRSSLLFETLRIIEEMGMWRPRVVIWENVAGVLDSDMKHAFADYLNNMVRLGYTNSYRVINAMNHGIPHKRERLFTVSFLGGIRFDFDKLRQRKSTHIKEFLQPEHEIQEQHIINVPSMLNKIPEFYKPTNKNYNRMLDVIDDYCWTITERQDRCPNAGVIKMSDGRYRYLTELECWRLLGFDDTDYYSVLKEFPTKKGKRNATLYAMAGNSIVVNVLEDLFYSILYDSHEKGETQQLSSHKQLALSI